MDSRGLGALLIAHNRVEKIGGNFGICSFNGQARMLLEPTQMEKVFYLYDNPAEFEQVFWEKVVPDSGETKRL